jgi:mono/diheme cytochrome c family protein
MNTDGKEASRGFLPDRRNHNKQKSLQVMSVRGRAQHAGALRLILLGAAGLFSFLALMGPWGVSSLAAERDLSIPQVPPEHLAEAKALKNPFKPTPENIRKGKAIFEDKGNCFACHGMEGRGDGPAAEGMDPSPRNFTNPAFHGLRTDGEMYWVIKNGSPGTAMTPMVGTVIDENEAWLVILYERSLSRK